MGEWRTFFLENWYFLIIVGLLVLIGGTILYLNRRNRKQKPELPKVESIVSALGKSNIAATEYIRHKINIRVHDHHTVDLEALKATGAIGINVVGKTLKFYYEADNEAIYEAIKERTD